MTEPLIPARLLFRFSVPCRYCEPLWSARGTGLDETYRLLGLAELEGQAPMADVRAGWSERGLAFRIEVGGKRQRPWCRASKLDDSDGVQLFVDTRDVHNVHRANRFCHRLVFLPAGTGRQYERPVAEPLTLNRARENPKPMLPKHLQVLSRIRPDGYLLECFIDGEGLTGFDPDEYPRLGFTYALLDSELGEQTFSVGGPLPYREDPSLWATLELVR